MHLLPTNLAPLADMVAKNEGKYAMTGIHLRVHGDNTYCAAATDGRRLLVVSGECPGDATDFPHATIRKAPNGATESIIPAPTWRKTFKDASKATRRMQKLAPHCRTVATVIGKKVTTFATAEPTQTGTDNVEGRFPPYMDVIPKGAGTAGLDVDAKELADLLLAAAACGETETNRVRLELHRKGMVILRAGSEKQSVIGLSVGLLGENGKDTFTCSAGTPQSEDGQTEERLREKIADLERDLAAAREAIANRDETIESFRGHMANQKVSGDANADMLRKQVAVLTAINKRLIHEKGLVGN